MSAMPARGGMADISDSEMRAAVLYMFTESIGSKK
jgi:cytochrome c5